MKWRWNNDKKHIMLYTQTVPISRKTYWLGNNVSVIFAITALWSGLLILWTLSNQMVIYHHVDFKIESVQSIASLDIWKNCSLLITNICHRAEMWKVTVIWSVLIERSTRANKMLATKPNRHWRYLSGHEQYFPSNIMIYGVWYIYIYICSQRYITL